MNKKKKTSSPNWGKGKSSWNKGVPRSKTTKDKISASMLGKKGSNYGKKEEEASGWKGADAKHKTTMHKWVERRKGKASEHICEFCGTRKAGDWANKKHDYKRVEEDYMALCKKCHRLYDFIRKGTSVCIFRGVSKINVNAGKGSEFIDFIKFDIN